MTRYRCNCCDAYVNQMSARQWCTECEREYASVISAITWDCQLPPCATPYSCVIAKRCLRDDVP